MQWKQSSLALAVRRDCSMPMSDGMLISSTVQCHMLKQIVPMLPEWKCAEDHAFQWASTAWAHNRSWLLSRRLTLKQRVKHFQATVRNHLVSRLVFVPLSTALLSRLRRWEGRALMKLTGLATVGLTTDEWRGRTRKARNIVAKFGYSDACVSLLQSVWRSARSWISRKGPSPSQRPDYAVCDFESIFNMHLDHTIRDARVSSGIRFSGRAGQCNVGMRC